VEGGFFIQIHSEKIEKYVTGINSIKQLYYSCNWRILLAKNFEVYGASDFSAGF